MKNNLLSANEKSNLNTLGFADSVNRWFKQESNKRLSISFLSVMFMLFTWTFVTATGLANPLFLPGPDAVYKAFVETLFDGYQGSTLFEHVGTSLYRILAAFLLACLVGIPLGVCGTRYGQLWPSPARGNVHCLVCPGIRAMTASLRPNKSAQRRKPAAAPGFQC